MVLGEDRTIVLWQCMALGWRTLERKVKLTAQNQPEGPNAGRQEALVDDLGKSCILFPIICEFKSNGKRPKVEDLVRSRI